VFIIVIAVVLGFVGLGYDPVAVIEAIAGATLLSGRILYQVWGQDRQLLPSPAGATDASPREAG
jgi:hypothetical protein